MNIKACYKKLHRYYYKVINLLVRWIFCLFPIRGNTIVFESEGDFWDNARAFYDYLIKNNYNQKYKIVWFVHNPEEYPSNLNVRFVSRFAEKINWEADFYCATSSCFIFTHAYWFKHWRKGQTVIHTTHCSLALKKAEKDLHDCFDFTFCSSIATKTRKGELLRARDNQIVVLGAPRNDLLFHNNDAIKKILPNIKNEKVILCMSTFRQTPTWEDGTRIDKFSINVINNIQELRNLNQFLEENKIYLLVKIHHLQDCSFLLKESLSNIIYLQDEDLYQVNLQLYELVGEADALLTDYSSIFYDYLLVDKPIGFLISDLDLYKRGFSISDPLKEMVGNKIYTLNDLFDFILQFIDNIDDYKEERKKLRDYVHQYQDDKNCERFLEFLKSKEILT